MIDNSMQNEIEKLFLNAFISNSSHDLLQLAKRYHHSGDSSGALSLASHCFAFQDSLNKKELIESLYLIVDILRDERYSRKYYLRYLALAIRLDKKIRMCEALRIIKVDGYRYVIIDIFILMYILLRIILLESNGIYPRSLAAIYRKFLRFFAK